jgi:hypothetical protein
VLLKSPGTALTAAGLPKWFYRERPGKSRVSRTNAGFYIQQNPWLCKWITFWETSMVSSWVSSSWKGKAQRRLFCCGQLEGTAVTSDHRRVAGGLQELRCFLSIQLTSCSINTTCQVTQLLLGDSFFIGSGKSVLFCVFFLGFELRPSHLLERCSYRLNHSTSPVL